MGEHLLPCPFCGHDAEWNKGQHGDGSDWHYIACTECEAMGGNSADQSREGSIAAWNLRVPPVEPCEVTDAMVAEGLKNYSEGGCMGLDEDERREVVRNILEAAIAKAEGSSK